MKSHKNNFVNDFLFEGDYNSNFVGRKSELEWLDQHLYRRYSSFSPLIITGSTGVGKTSLIKQWFSSRRISYTPLWLDLSSRTDETALDDLISQIHNQRESYKYERGLTVVIDGSDFWTLKQHEKAADRIFNYKVVSALIFIRQKPLKLSRSQALHLEPFSSASALELLKKLLTTELSDENLQNAAEVSRGIPLALSLLSRLIKGENVESVISTPDKPLYKLENYILVPKKEIIPVVKPVIVSANNSLISTLKKQPKDIYRLSPRDFEKLLADLLKDMGWDVELTKQTRDGGADILAYLNTGVGRLLCLVEAKHYREDRKIGVDLVRTLYGTLCDAQANSAMMVTTSTFTSDAKTFQQKHKYQLSLKDYADIVEWILKFGKLRA